VPSAARAAGPRAERADGAGRPLAEGPAQAGRPDRRELGADRRGRRRARAQHGDRRPGRGPDRGRRAREGRMKAPRENEYGSAWAGTLRAENVDSEVRVAGWVHRRRDHGGLIFIDLRDRTGLLQLVFRPEEAPDAHGAAHALRAEDVLTAKGR